VDNEDYSFDSMWKHLVDEYFNAPNWKPENLFSDRDERIRGILILLEYFFLQKYFINAQFCVKDIDPRAAPPQPWSASQLRDNFRFYKGLITHCDDFYRRSGNLEGGCNVDEADRYFVHASNAAKENEGSYHIYIHIFY
jgi:hypothetical protein